MYISGQCTEHHDVVHWLSLHFVHQGGAMAHPRLSNASVQNVIMLRAGLLRTSFLFWRC